MKNQITLDDLHDLCLDLVFGTRYCYPNIKSSRDDSVAMVSKWTWNKLPRVESNTSHLLRRCDLVVGRYDCILYLHGGYRE